MLFQPWEEVQIAICQLSSGKAPGSVAVTDLFSHANQWPHHTLTNQGQSTLISSSSLELFFLVLFGSHDKPASTQLAAKKDLSPLLSYGHPTWKIFTEEHAATSYKLKNQHTNRRHQKEPFFYSDSFTSAIIINLLLLCFQRSFVIYLYCQLIYSVMETNH